MGSVRFCHIKKPHSRPLWAWTSNYGYVFPLLFRSHFHFDTGGICLQGRLEKTDCSSERNREPFTSGLIKLPRSAQLAQLTFGNGHTHTHLSLSVAFPALHTSAHTHTHTHHRQSRSRPDHITVGASPFLQWRLVYFLAFLALQISSSFGVQYRECDISYYKSKQRMFLALCQWQLAAQQYLQSSTQVPWMVIFKTIRRQYYNESTFLYFLHVPIRKAKKKRSL